MSVSAVIVEVSAGGGCPGAATVSTTTRYTAHKSTVLAEGARGSAVRMLQRGLRGMAVDGVFGPLTARMVRALQRSYGLAQTGVVTPEIWDVLEQRDHPFLDRRLHVLRPGDSGDEVRAVQRLLGVPATGRFDHATRQAVKELQARSGLASTGVIASRTWSVLDRLSA